jgi:DNA/RNA-binding domain of Phe-tRNA-synthetase-like protein
MELIISEAIRTQFPDLRIGIVVAHSIDNTHYSEALVSAVNLTFTSFADKFESLEVFEEEKNIKIWRDVYRSFGTNPKKKTPTAEALLSRVIKSRFVPHISPAVDSYLMAETLHALPIGGYDLEKVEGDIVLRLSSDQESFLGIGGSNEETLSAGEVVYADATRILTRRWNYKDCDHAKVADATKSIALFVEGPKKEISDSEISQTAEAMAANLHKYCGATVKTLFLSSRANRIQLD